MEEQKSINWTRCGDWVSMFVLSYHQLMQFILTNFICNYNVDIQIRPLSFLEFDLKSAKKVDNRTHKFTPQHASRMNTKWLWTWSWKLCNFICIRMSMELKCVEGREKNCTCPMKIFLSIGWETRNIWSEHFSGVHNIWATI